MHIPAGKRCDFTSIGIEVVQVLKNVDVAVGELVVAGDGDVLSSFAFARKSNRVHFFCSIIWLHPVSKKKRGQQRTVAAKQTKIKMISPIWVKKGQSCSSQLFSGPVPSSQSGLPSHFDVRSMHFMVPFLHGKRYGSSLKGKTV